MRLFNVAALLDSVWECLFACARKIVDTLVSSLAQSFYEPGYRSRYRPNLRQSGLSTSLASGAISDVAAEDNHSLIFKFGASSAATRPATKYSSA